MHDLVINNADVVLFNPHAVKKVNIGVRNGVISQVSPEVLGGRQTIDATGKVVSPGFIDFHSHVDGKVFSAECVARQGATTTIGGERSFNGKLLKDIFKDGFLINHGFYVSHSFTLRRAVGIKDPYLAAETGSIKEMEVLAEQFLINGAFGIHFGLEFVPGTSEAEIVSLAEVAKRHNRKLIVHLRKDGEEALNHFAEIEKIASETGVGVHISHLMYMVGFKGVMEEVLRRIDEAREKGQDITADTGLYAAFPSCIGSSILDSKWQEAYGKRISYDNVLISSGIFSGQFCDEEIFHYLRSEFPNTLVTVFACDESEIVRALKKEYVYVSTNAADGPHYENIGHPETAGTFPRLLGTYVRDRKAISLCDAIYKISLGPAMRFGLKGKGIISEGYDADIVIFDKNNIKDTADYVGFGNPNAKPTGIATVIVNGEIILKDNIIVSGARPGRVIYSDPDT
jgi:N-acyl-D-amino-acid deacylase